MRRLCSTLVVALLVCAAGVQARNFPERTVNLLVPFAAGGSTDVLARVLSSRLAEQWGQQVVVNNVGGDSSVSGTQAVATAPPDGHALLVANAALTINEALSRDLPYHALRSFAPISLLAGQHLVLAVQGSSTIYSVGELIEKARHSSTALAYGTAPIGSLSHLAGELLKLMSSARVVNAASINTHAVLEELMAARLSFAIVPLPTALPLIKSGRARAIAVAGSNRATALPDVPTIGASIAGYGVSTWIGVLAPRGISVKLVRELNADMQAIMRRPDVMEMLGNLGYEPRGSTVGDFDNRLRADIERYSRVVFEAGIARPARTIASVQAEPVTTVPRSPDGVMKRSASATALAR